MAVVQKVRTLDYCIGIHEVDGEVFSGKRCYNETLMYRVEKYDGSSNTGAPLQTIYVPNSQEIDTFQYIDTQVKYNKVYTYVIYTYQIVGTKYSYIDSLLTPDNNGFSALLVKSKPRFGSMKQRFTNTQIESWTTHLSVLKLSSCHIRVSMIK